MTNRSKIFTICLLTAVSLSACKKKNPNEKPADTPVSGEISISADESLMPIVEEEVAAFQALYKKARIKVIYGAESEAIYRLLNNEVRVAIVSRPLEKEEAKVFEKQRFKPRTIKVGIDAIALIVNKSNPDTVLSYEQLQGIIRGEIKEWKQINPKSALKGIKIIFDNDSTASVRYMKDSIAEVKGLPPNCYAVNSNPKVIDYIAENKDAIGLIGVSWISDHDNTTSIGFLNKVNIVGLKKPGKGDGEDFFQPFQAYMATRDYPITRNIYMISRESRAGLGTGFMSFVAGEKGQRVILKAGLVPATMPVRIVEISKNPIY